MTIKWYYILLFLLFSCSVKSSNNTDTLTIAKLLIQKGKFKRATKILNHFEQTHPDDLNVLWLYGQTAYWAGHMKTFHALYEKAMIKFPSNYYLKLDYALKLLELGEVEKANPLLDLYKKYDPSSSSLILAQAKISFWQGDYKKSLQLLSNELLLEEKKTEAEHLKTEVLAAESPWLIINTDYLKDDQPMQVITPSITAGSFINAFVNPSFFLSDILFKTDTSSTTSKELLIGNKLNFYKTHMVLSMNGGIVQFPDKTKKGMGTLEITKTSFNYMKVTGRVSFQPYFTTISSLSNPTVPCNLTLSGSWNNLNSWTGKITGNMELFSKDKNVIYNFSAWLFGPPVKFAGFQARIGYAYGYGTSKKNQYVAKENLSTIVSGYSQNTPIKGIYDPYFTPMNQQAHSVLFNFTYDNAGKITAGINSGICVIGQTDDPYLFLDKKNGNELFINKGYSRLNFYPVKIESFILYKPVSRVSLKVGYTFLRNNFYTSHWAGLSLIVNFWNEQKEK